MGACPTEIMTSDGAIEHVQKWEGEGVGREREGQ